MHIYLTLLRIKKYYYSYTTKVLETRYLSRRDLFIGAFTRRFFFRVTVTFVFTRKSVLSCVPVIQYTHNIE